MSAKRYSRLGRGLLITGFAMFAGCSVNTTDASKGASPDAQAPKCDCIGVAVILFEHTDMKGESCTVYVPPGDTAVSIDAACGAGWSNRVSSAHVMAFRQWQLLKFQGKHWRQEWGYGSNHYTGSLDIPNFAVQRRPPPADMDVYATESMNDEVDRLQLQSFGRSQSPR